MNRLVSSTPAYSSLDIDYRFFRLYEHDFAEARETLKMMGRYRRHDVLFALLRDAVVAYARPFSVNKKPTKGRHELPLRFVPRVRRSLHRELIALRMTMFAHTDFIARSPRVTLWDNGEPPRPILSFSNPPYEAWLRRRSEVASLVAEMEGAVKDEIARIEETALWRPVAT